MGELKKEDIERLHELIIEEKLTWEGLIREIVKKEKMDPWNIDINLLIKEFYNAIKNLPTNLKIAGKFILALAILLAIKAEFIIPKKEEKKEKKDIIKENINIKVVPRVFGIRERKVTLNELIDYLRKAINIYEKKRKKYLKKKKKKQLFTFEIEKFDINKEMEILYLRILTFFRKYGKEKISFWELLPSEEKITIVRILLTLLHLENNQKIILEQEELFSDIYVKPRRT